MCKSMKITFINTQPIFEGKNIFYMNDGIHLSTKGKIVLARLVSEAVFNTCEVFPNPSTQDTTSQMIPPESRSEIRPGQVRSDQGN